MSMDAVKAIGEVVIEGMGIGDAQMVRFHMYEEIPPVGTKLYGQEALSQVRKQALLEAAEIFDKQTGREMFGPTVAEELRKLAEE
jgi:hypothetical protein